MDEANSPNDLGAEDLEDAEEVDSHWIALPGGPGIEFLRTRRSQAGDEYLVVPMLPTGFHISFHRSGATHIRDDYGLDVKLPRPTLQPNLQLDYLLAKPKLSPSARLFMPAEPDDFLDALHSVQDRRATMAPCAILETIIRDGLVEAKGTHAHDLVASVGGGPAPLFDATDNTFHLAFIAADELRSFRLRFDSSSPLGGLEPALGLPPEFARRIEEAMAHTQGVIDADPRLFAKMEARVRPALANLEAYVRQVVPGTLPESIVVPFEP